MQNNTQPVWTPEELVMYIKSKPINFILFVFEFHAEQVIANLRALGFPFVNADAAEIKLKDLYENEEYDLLTKAIDVDLTFKDLPEEYRAAVNKVLEQNKTK